MKQPFLIFLACWLAMAPSSAQDTRSDNLLVDRPDNIDLTLARGFLLISEEQEGVPINAGSSGTISLGLGLKLHLPGNVVGLRVNPNISWTRFAYDQTAEKQFPTEVDPDRVLSVEKHRFTFIDLPVGVFVNITKDEDGDSRFFMEAGGFVSYKTSGVYKTRYEDELLDQEVRVRVRGVKDVEEWRYGVYGRIGYKWIALHFAYRLSEVFKPNPLNANGQPSGFEVIDLPPMELGLAIFL